MESIYNAERFKSSENVNLLKYFTQFSESIASDLPAPSFNQNTSEESSATLDNTNRVIKAMGIDVTQEELNTLEKECSIDNLLCDGEVKRRPIQKPQKYTLRGMILDGLPFISKNSDLEVLKKKAEIEASRSCEMLIRMNKENFHNPIIDENEEKNLPKDLTSGCDFVMHIYFYKPFSYNFLTKNYTEKFRFSQEIQILGRNTLTELRDIITCTSDTGIQAEVESPAEDISYLYKAKEIYPSGFFFIDGVFYNDMRSPKAIDYSEVIKQWGKERQVGHFTSSDMHQTKVQDLSPRFGYPYLYMHQGGCEHIMVFADAHILTVNDCLNSEQYPRTYAMNKNTSIMCYMCNLFVARWLVKQYTRLPQSNTFLCTKCTQAYCYKDGEKIGSFKLYPSYNKFFDLNPMSKDEQRPKVSSCGSS